MVCFHRCHAQGTTQKLNHSWLWWQVDLCELKTSLVNKVSSRPAKATMVRPCLEKES